MQFPRPHMPYSFMRRQAEVVKRDNQLLIIILYRLQRSILTAHRLFIYQHVGGLQIYRTVAFPGDEVHLFFFGTSGIDIIACPEQLQIDKILQFITHPIGRSGIEKILKDKVVDVIFRRTGQYSFPRKSKRSQRYARTSLRYSLCKQPRHHSPSSGLGS